MVRFRRGMLLAVTLLAVAGPILADVVTPSIYLLEPGEVETEDIYIAASSARIDGRIEGDVVVASGRVDIGGTVAGDVMVLSHSSVVITGNVEGSVRGLARDLSIDGNVADDVAVAAGSIRMDGTIGRDLLLVGGSVSIDGAVGRNVHGRFLDGEINADVGRDVDVSVRSLGVGPSATVDGDLLYRADTDASISGGAQVGGQLRRLPARATFIVRVWLIGATILGFLAFLASGAVLLFTFRSTMARAAGLVRTATWRTIWVGFLAVLGLPLLSVVFVFTVVGAPVGILLLVLWLLALVLAPVPAVAAGGDLILRGRGGLLGAFLVGAVIWRFGIWAIPVVGVLLYTAALMAGLGGIVMAAWRQRRAGAAALPSLAPPPPIVETAEAPDDWLPPLAPTAPEPSGGAESEADPTTD